MDVMRAQEIKKRLERRVKEVDASTVLALLAPDSNVIDIREDEEVIHGMIPGAKHVKRGALESWLEDHVRDVEDIIVLYCESGKRSVYAVNALMSLGYKDVSSLRGGINNWKALGLPIEQPSSLNKCDFARYARQMMLPEVGIRGQENLAAAKVLVVGAGGLGSPCLYYLVAAGVGTVGIADHDIVDQSNLHRQILYDQYDVGTRKAIAAERKIKNLNTHVKTNLYIDAVTENNAADIIASYDLVIDCTDNFAVRYALSDAAVKVNIPIVHGAVHRFQGTVGVFNLPGGPCYRCVYPEPPPKALSPSCTDAGVLGVTPGVIGVLQAAEAIKLILSPGAGRHHALLRYSGTSMSLTSVEIAARPDCPCQFSKKNEAPQCQTLL
ncbi:MULTISPECIES: ThiF family adenylyltransferase [Pseudomonas]|uniref:ThiF family adenylyltransferase n=1 Tax=Pseudomonas TaxID=286 RepID=UPI000812BA3C|nr:MULTISPECIES: ThiF family adenylyltransferase [Pseudomonas]RZI18352.1 molybdopterin biosynthesis protein MoeB [Pseudomonas orientalis]CRM33311.1 putative adenylyltransferase/sulfurtransferase MoeZ [Pseudomonas sp. 28 E 9]